MAGCLRALGRNDEADCVDRMCCDCWTGGCGLDGCFGCVASGLEAINPIMEYVADCIWICGSPLAFPLVFCFPPGQETEPPGGGWQISMMETPIRAPCQWCIFTMLPCCGQWYLRYKLLDGDMSKYKLWQGYHDGPHCLARQCPGAPCTIESGTYGESNCPHAFLCLEVSVLAGAWSVCCSFNVNRRMIKDERKLGNDPTENRVDSCIGFFSNLASQCCCLGVMVCVCSAAIGCCAPNSPGAQECSQEGGQAGAACRSCAQTCWRGIWSVKIIAMGCMSAQMDHELKHGKPLASPPLIKKMDRGDPEDGGTLDDDTDAWWKKP